MKKIFLLLVVMNLILGTALAHENFTEAKKLVDSKISCEKLTEKQLEEVGDYIMELMHPGKSHELMDEMMGGEGSENVKSMHINMAKNMYCNEGEGMSNMMGMMNMMQGTYSYKNNSTIIFSYFFNILLIIFLILLIFWLIKQIQKK